MPEQLDITKEVHRIAADLLKEHIDDTGTKIHHLHHHTNHDNDRDKVRCVCYHLNEFTVFHTSQFIQADSQKNGERKVYDQRIYTEDQCILNHSDTGGRS